MATRIQPEIVLVGLAGGAFAAFVFYLVWGV